MSDEIHWVVFGIIAICALCPEIPVTILVVIAYVFGPKDES